MEAVAGERLFIWIFLSQEWSLIYILSPDFNN